MRKLRWGAAGMAAALLIPYGLHLHQVLRRAPVVPRAAVADSPPPSRAEPPSPEAERVLRALAAARSRAVSPPSSSNATPSGRSPAGAAPAGAAPSWKPADGEPSTLATLPPVSSDAWARGKFADFTPEELADMAGRCELRWQLPPYFAATPPSLGAGYDRALAASRARYLQALRALYVEATGDADGAAHLAPSLQADAIRRADDGDGVATQRRLAAARAGDPVALDGSLRERYLQLQLGAGDDFERALADEVGADRAHALRLAAGPKFTLTGCDPEHALYRSQR